MSLLAVWMSLCLLAAATAVPIPNQFVSKNLTHTRDAIADLLELKEPEVATNPLFGSVIRSINTSCQRKDDLQLMNATLDVYQRIFSSLLPHGSASSSGVKAPLLAMVPEGWRTQVERDLKVLQKRMEEQRYHLNRRLGHDEDELSKLSTIKVDDPLVQRKALAEILQVYQAVSVVVDARSHGKRKC